MDAEKLLRDLVKALGYQNFSGFYTIGGKDLCVAGCREGDIPHVFNDHRGGCPYRRAVEAIDSDTVEAWFKRNSVIDDPFSGLPAGGVGALERG